MHENAKPHGDLFFKDEEALEYYKLGRWQFVGEAGASFAKYGASADGEYNSGVAIFTKTRGGLMFEAVISGARYGYLPPEPASGETDSSSNEGSP